MAIHGPANTTDIYPRSVIPYLHTAERCYGRFCVLHNPSDHKMRGWPIIIRETALAERACTHGVGHPDPDSVVWMNRVTGQQSWSIHGCDGCCFDLSR